MAQTLQDATTGFYDALNAVLGGDAEPMLSLWSRADDVTYMSPFGELLVGWEPIRASWEDQAHAHLGGRVDPEGIRVLSSEQLGVVVGFERGNIVIDGVQTRVDIRATSTYRLEHDRWAMVAHHTDPLG